MRDEDVVMDMKAREAARYAQASVGADVNKLRPHPVNECSTDASCSRMSARGVLEQRYEALLREANGIHALLQALPGSMGHQAEEALWKIVVDQRR